MAQYPIAPWLNVSPADFGAAASRGAEISLGRQRLQQEAAQANQRAAQAAQEMAARREQEQQNAQREEQQLAYQHAYQTAELGLKQQQQEQSEQQFQMDVKAAAQKSQVMQAAQAELDAGGDPSKVWMKYGPLLGMTGSSLSALTKTESKPTVTPITLPDGRKLDAIRTGPGSFKIIGPPTNTGQTNIQTVPVIGPHGEELPGMVGAPGAGGAFRIHNVPKETPQEATQKRIDARKAALGLTNTTATATSAAPPPSKEGQHKLPRTAGKPKPTQAAIEHLMNNPTLAPQFDAKYGDGEAAKILKQQPAGVLEPDYSE